MHLQPPTDVVTSRGGRAPLHAGASATPHLQVKSSLHARKACTAVDTQRNAPPSSATRDRPDEVSGAGTPHPRTAASAVKNPSVAACSAATGNGRATIDNPVPGRSPVRSADAQLARSRLSATGGRTIAKAAVNKSPRPGTAQPAKALSRAGRQRPQSAAERAEGVAATHRCVLLAKAALPKSCLCSPIARYLCIVSVGHARLGLPPRCLACRSVGAEANRAPPIQPQPGATGCSASVGPGEPREDGAPSPAVQAPQASFAQPVTWKTQRSFYTLAAQATSRCVLSMLSAWQPVGVHLRAYGGRHRASKSS